MPPPKSLVSSVSTKTSACLYPLSSVGSPIVSLKEKLSPFFNVVPFMVLQDNLIFSNLFSSPARLVEKLESSISCWGSAVSFNDDLLVFSIEFIISLCLFCLLTFWLLFFENKIEIQLIIKKPC